MNGYRCVNVFSVDVACGAVTTYWLMAHTLCATVSWTESVALAISVWLLYTCDHLRDAQQINGHASTLRHRLHQKFYRPIAIVVVIVTVALLALLPLLPAQVLLRGLVLGCAALLYLWMQRRLLGIKEFAGAALYTAGITVPVIDLELNLLSALLLVALFLTAYGNLLLFAWYDAVPDTRQKQPSLVALLGRDKVHVLLVILYALLLLLLFAGAWVTGAAAFLVLLVINAIHVVILGLPHYFGRKDRYRLAGDAAFFLAVLVWLL